MGIDYCANYADVIKWDKIEELVPAEAAQYLETLNAVRGTLCEDTVLEALARSICYDDLRAPNELIEDLGQLFPDDDDDNSQAAAATDRLIAAYINLVEAFRRATRVGRGGLRLELRYHDQENNGCRGDELDGAFWHVEGVYQRTAAGKKFKDFIERGFYTSWG